MLLRDCELNSSSLLAAGRGDLTASSFGLGRAC